MATKNVTKVLVAESFLGGGAGPYYSGNNVSGEFTNGGGTTFNYKTALTAGQLAVINPATGLGVVSNAVPDQIALAVYNSNLTYALTTPTIKKGTVRSWRQVDYAAGSQGKTTITVPTTVAVGDEFYLTIDEQGVLDRKPISVRTIVVAPLATREGLVDEIVRVLSKLLSREFTVTKASATAVDITPNEEALDFFQTDYRKSWKINVFLTRSTTSAGSVEGWGAGSGVVVTAPTAGQGTPRIVTEEWYKNGLGYNGDMNRLDRFRAPVYNPVDLTTQYDTYVVDTIDPLTVRGQAAEVNQQKQFVIYIDSTAVAVFHPFITAVLDALKA